MSESPCTFLEWDSQFFGHRIGRVNGSHLDAERGAAVKAWAAEHSIDCLYFLAEPNDPITVRTAEDGGFRLQDMRMNFTLSRPKNPEPLPKTHGIDIRSARPDDLEALRPTARHAYIQSRFYNDPHFTEEQCAALYDRWLTRSVTEPTEADQTFVAELDGNPVGYMVVTLDQEIKQGTLGLLGVAEAARGKSLGRLLVHHSLLWFWEQGMETAQVTTQARNLTGQRIYQRFGFLTHSLLLWYHWWPSDTRS